MHMKNSEQKSFKFKVSRVDMHSMLASYQKCMSVLFDLSQITKFNLLVCKYAKVPLTFVRNLPFPSRFKQCCIVLCNKVMVFFCILYALFS